MVIQGHVFDVNENRLGDYRGLLRHNNVGLIFQISNYIANERSKNGSKKTQFSTTLLSLMPHIQRTPTKSEQPLYPHKLESLRYMYISAANSMGLSSLKF